MFLRKAKFILVYARIERLLADGYIELTEENAKIYGDAFYLEDKERKDYTKVPINIKTPAMKKADTVTTLKEAQDRENVAERTQQGQSRFDKAE